MAVSDPANPSGVSSIVESIFAIDDKSSLPAGPYLGSLLNITGHPVKIID